MKISTKGRYAVRMLLDLAEHAEEGFVSLKDVAQRQGVSKKYLEQIIILLGGSGFLKTTRGNQGGYMLAKAPAEYTMADILRVTEGSLAPVACLDENSDVCGRSGDCVTLDVWKGLYDVICDYLDGITLQQLLDMKKNAAVCAEKTDEP